MEIKFKKFQHKYSRVRDELGKWDDLQSRLMSQFSNATSIIERLEILKEAKNYGGLRCVPGIKKAVLGKQLETVHMIHLSMLDTMKEFHGIVLSLDKMAHDGGQLFKGGSSPTHQMQLTGIKPVLADCLDGLRLIHDMYKCEYHLKSSIISSLTWKCSSSEIAGLRQLLMDQPNIPRDEVQSIMQRSISLE